MNINYFLLQILYKQLFDPEEGAEERKLIAKKFNIIIEPAEVSEQLRQPALTYRQVEAGFEEVLDMALEGRLGEHEARMRIDDPDYVDDMERIQLWNQYLDNLYNEDKIDNADFDIPTRFLQWNRSASPGLPES